MDMKTTSRKDDLISLYYLLIYLIEDDLPFLPNQINLFEKQMQFNEIKQKKKELTPEKLCFTS